MQDNTVQVGRNTLFGSAVFAVALVLIFAGTLAFSTSSRIQAATCPQSATPQYTTTSCSPSDSSNTSTPAQTTQAQPAATSQSSLPNVNTGTFACKALAATQSGSNPLRYTFTAVAVVPSNANVTYIFDFGDNNVTRMNTTAAPKATVGHTYAQAGTYAASVAVVDARDPSTLTTCSTQVVIAAPAAAASTPPYSTQQPPNTIAPQPQTTATPAYTPPVAPLPNTGATGAVGLFTLTTAIGSLLHRFVLRRKL